MREMGQESSHLKNIFALLQPNFGWLDGTPFTGQGALVWQTRALVLRPAVD
jgi:hypothetical protein